MEYDLRRNLKILKNRVMEEEIFQEDRTTKPEVIGGKKNSIARSSYSRCRSQCVPQMTFQGAAAGASHRSPEEDHEQNYLSQRCL